MLKKIRSKLSFSDLAKGSSVAFGLRIFGMIAGYIFTLLISNYYGASALGIYALSFSFLQMISTISRLGMDTASVKFIADYYAKQEYEWVKIFYFMVVKFILPLTIILTVVFIYISPYVAKYVFGKEYLTEYFQLISLAIVPYTFIFIQTESLRALGKIKSYMFIQTISTTVIGLILLTIAMFTLKRTLDIPINILIVSIYLTFFMSIYLWRKELLSFSKAKKDQLTKTNNMPIGYKDLFAVALPLTLSSYLAIVMGSTDIIMLGIFMTEKDVGIYTVVIKLTTMSLVVFMAVNTITMSKFSAFWGAKKLNEMKKLSYESTKLILFMSLPIFLLLWLFPREILGMFGNEFTSGMSALIIMTVGQFLFIVAGPVWQMMNMTNKQKIFFYFSLFSVLVNVVLNYILIPIHGLEGAAYATVTGGIVLNVLSIWYINNKFSFLTIYIPLYQKSI